MKALVVLALNLPVAAIAESTLPAKPADLFTGTKVWTVHLKLTAEQWDAMEPKGGPGPGGPGGPGFGPPGEPGGRGPGGPRMFGPSSFLVPAFLQGDRNNDRKLSGDEFRDLGEQWFTNWDKQKQERLNAEQLRSGIDETFKMPAFGPGGPGGGPGGPGGRGGRGPGQGMQAAEGRRNGLSGMMGIDFQYVHADLEFEGAVLKDVAIRYKGNSTFMQSRNSLKRSFKINLNKYVKGQKLAGVTELNLHNNVSDPGLMNESLSYRLFRDANVPAPRTAYARVFVSVPGKHEKKYFGVYSLVEDIDKNFAEERFGDRSGAIFKPSTRNLFAHLGDDWSKYQQTYDPKTDLTGKQKRRVMEFAKFVTTATDAEFAAGIAEYMDLEEFARFMAVNVWVVNMDSILAMGQNFYVYLHPETNKFLFLPWDLDLSFGHMGGGTELSIMKPWRGENRFLERVFQVEAFRKLYVARMSEFNKSLFAAERIRKQVDEVAVVIRASVKEESETALTRFDKVIAGERVERGGFGPPGGGPPGGGVSGMERGRRPGGPGGGPGDGDPIKAFVAPRAKSVADQLDGKSEGRMEQGGFGPPGMGGPGGPGGPGGRGAPSPAMFLAPALTSSMDANKDGSITRQEFLDGFGKWFQSWSGGAKEITEEQLREGLNRTFRPPGF